MQGHLDFKLGFDVKSFSMVFTAGQISLSFSCPLILLLSDLVFFAGLGWAGESNNSMQTAPVLLPTADVTGENCITHAKFRKHVKLLVTSTLQICSLVNKFYRIAVFQSSCSLKLFGITLVY